MLEERVAAQSEVIRSVVSDYSPWLWGVSHHTSATVSYRKIQVAYESTARGGQQQHSVLACGTAAKVNCSGTSSSSSSRRALQRAAQHPATARSVSACWGSCRGSLLIRELQRQKQQQQLGEHHGEHHGEQLRASYSITKHHGEHHGEHQRVSQSHLARRAAQSITRQRVVRALERLDTRQRDRSGHRGRAGRARRRSADGI